MATGSSANFFYLSGNLIDLGSSPDLSTSSPYGGTLLGSFRNGVFAFNPTHAEIAAEEFGGQKVEWVQASEAAALTVVLREFDADALQTIFPNTTLSTLTDKASVEGRVHGSGVVGAGSRATDRSTKILVESVSPELVPSLLLYNAVPMPSEASEIQIGTVDQFGLAVVFECTYDSSGRTYDLMPLKDMPTNP